MSQSFESTLKLTCSIAKGLLTVAVFIGPLFIVGDSARLYNEGKDMSDLVIHMIVSLVIYSSIVIMWRLSFQAGQKRPLTKR